MCYAPCVNVREQLVSLGLSFDHVGTRTEALILGLDRRAFYSKNHLKDLGTSTVFMA